MATNKVNCGDRMTYIAPSGGVTSGTLVLLGSILVMPVADANEGELFAADAEGTFTVPAEGGVSGQAIAQGGIVYWDDSAGQMTATQASNYRCGTAAIAKLTAETSITVRLDGTSMVQEAA